MSSFGPPARPQAPAAHPPRAAQGLRSTPLSLAPAKEVHALLVDRGFSPPYEISYRGLKLPRVSAAFRRRHLRRGTDLPQVGRRRLRKDCWTIGAGGCASATIARPGLGHEAARPAPCSARRRGRALRRARSAVSGANVSLFGIKHAKRDNCSKSVARRPCRLTSMRRRPRLSSKS